MTISKKSIEVLQSCYLVSPGDDRKRQMLRFQHGEMAEIGSAPLESGGLPAIYFRKSQKEDFLSLLKETEVALRKNKIFGASPQLAESVLVLSIAYRQTDTRVTLEQMVEEHQDVEATMFIGIPPMAVLLSGEAEQLILGFRIGRFEIGGGANFKHQLIFEASLPDSKNSDAPALPKVGAWIARSYTACRIISAAFDKSLPNSVRDHHLGHLSLPIFKDFKSEFSNDQSIPVALGAPAFDADALFSLHELRVDVAFGKLASTSNILLNHGNKTIPANISEIRLKSQLLIELQGESPLESCPDIDRVLGTFARFLLKAKAHDTGSRTSDAFIHCVFALDLALGGKQDPTKNTTRRAAVIYSNSAGISFKAAEKELREIFDARSKYVHDGIEISGQKFALLLEICSLVAECLLRVRLAHGAEGEKFITEHWYPRLDLLVAAMIAGVELGSEHFLQCGLKSLPKPELKLIH
jgi:hypothetical protein